MKGSTVVNAISILLFTTYGSVYGELHNQNDPLKKAIDSNINLFDLIPKGKSLDLLLDYTLGLYAPTSSAVENEECRQDSEWYKKAVKSGELWAIRMFDASSKLPDGVFVGNAVMLGNYDECLDVEDITTDKGKFSGQHCLVSVGKSSVFSTIDLRDKVEAGIDMEERFPNNQLLGGAALPHILSELSFTWAVCIPSSCTPRDLELHLRRTLRSSVLENVTVNVKEQACNSRAEVPVHNRPGQILKVLIVLYLSLVVVSTCYDLVCPKSKPGPDGLRVFSVCSHYVHLTRPTTQDNNNHNMAIIDGVRAMSCVWVIAQHRAFFTAFSPAVNYNRMRTILQDWTFEVINNGSLCTDSFFVLSGVLVSYGYLKYKDSGVKFNLFQYYLYRYVRMTPLFAVFVTFFAISSPSDGGDGPFWKANTSIAKTNCENNWLYELLYIMNYRSMREVCIGASWQLAADMQLYWLSPLILYPLWKWPRTGKALLVGILAAGLGVAVLVPYIYQFRVIFLPKRHMNELHYMPTHVRFTPWLIGIGLGYALHTTRGATVELSRTNQIGGWLLSGLLMGGALFLSSVFVQPDHVYNRLISSLYLGLMRPAWALGLAWLIFACVKGHGGPITKFLSNRRFLIISRLTYSIFFTHGMVISHSAATLKTLQYISKYTFFTLFLSDLVLSLISGLCLHLIVEAPLTRLTDYFLGMAGGRNKEKKL